MAHLPSRRRFILGLSAAIVAGRAQAALAAAPGENRLVVIVLRGALDGLAAVAPHADPKLKELREGLLPPPPGAPGGLLDIGGAGASAFGLHPELAQFHALLRAGEAAVVHAIAGPYRGRSHFDGQDQLESGAERRLAAGWLNRAVLAAWPAEARPAPDSVRKALAAGPAVPLLLRGQARISNWVPRNLPAARPDAMARLATLYARDPLLGPVLTDAEAGRRFAEAALGAHAPPGQGNGGGDRAQFVAVARAAGGLLAEPRGPRIAALELNGFDTHATQVNRLGPLLGTLDAGFAALKETLGPAWRQTAVLALTEFGRTVRMNGTGGTDHGTAGVAFLLGGAVAGGRVLGEWPGLAELHEGRDLLPTTDLRALAKGLLAGHMRLPAAALDRDVFPDSAAVAPMRGLLRA